MGDKWQKPGRERVIKRGSIQYASEWVDIPESERQGKGNSIDEVGSLHKLVSQADADAAIARALADMRKEFGI